METERNILTDEKWNAIIHNDVSYDGVFYYAVKTTGIFCRPSCKSRVPNKENVLVFATAEAAIKRHFRPCKRCRPNGLRLPDEEWVAQITEYIDGHYHEPLTLSVLADMCHGSPYHLQRTFKKIRGISPIEYVQKKRLAKAGDLLMHTDKTVMEIALTVGFPNTAHFATLFKKRTGSSPTEYRKTAGTRQGGSL
ncbi:bifunctional transcriptional activator/DNA repair enzyme AdaA [Bacillus siamensis]|uniref:bifunctional transcriptional activator/DNA repair enzyme AdaA n=1 Tax=Bacillus siamensis TaxID=659243 RepID=UPI002E21B1C3|nr:bifunctional transcriptional activator/DNA repair enzyme AdaA [Bacillus siamensis]MED0775034.1 bifunctional transcriptional activator/DNA repair enzyme AdaA [Bacillus siamensis]MED0779968.1 bifunctional transcriptional activator/DNA repair enzyme AdaA [Bacillus siamensis]MED0834554.1 bifunctional transcriptional activator/DNA repair enzyme AdaA [Bacillus siamensis]